MVAAWSGRAAYLFACLVRMEREAAYPVPIICRDVLVHYIVPAAFFRLPERGGATCPGLIIKAGQINIPVTPPDLFFAIVCCSVPFVRQGMLEPVPARYSCFPDHDVFP